MTHAAARIKVGMARELRLHNLNARRDWGYAADYVRAMWLMLQKETPDDYVVGTGHAHSVRPLCQVALGHLGPDHAAYVKSEPHFFRPAEVDLLVSDPSKARTKLGWKPTVSFEELVVMMVETDLKHLQAEQQFP